MIRSLANRIFQPSRGRRDEEEAGVVRRGAGQRAPRGDVPREAVAEEPERYFLAQSRGTFLPFADKFC